MNEKTQPHKIIAIEEMEGPFKALFQKVMRMVPDKDRNDRDLQRLIAFRLKIDGEALVTEYLVQKARDAVTCKYTGRFYDFIKDDTEAKACRQDNGGSPDPPEVA